MASHPSFNVSLVTPAGSVFEGEAEMIVVPGAAGGIGVLARHAPLEAMLEAGTTRISLPGGELLELVTGPGFFEVRSDQVLVLVDDAAEVRAIDAGQASEQLETARAELEALDRGEIEGDRWRIEQRIRHAEQKLAAVTSRSGAAG